MYPIAMPFEEIFVLRESSREGVAREMGFGMVRSAPELVRGRSAEEAFD